jgi:signal peptidase
MKKSYFKIIVLYLIFFIVIILNSFEINILNDFDNIIFLVLILILFKYLLGFEKDRHRNTKDIIFEIIIFTIIYYLLYFLSGILIGFSKTPNFYSLNSIIKFIIPMTTIIILEELLRYNLFCKLENKLFFQMLTCLILILFDLSVSFSYSILSDSNKLFLFIAETILPITSLNIACSYLSLKSGYKPSIILRLLITVVPYLLPINPNPTAYVKSIIDFLIPFIITYKIYKFLDKYKDKDLIREYHRKNISFLFIPVLITIISVYFVSGYFKYYAIAVASGSMTPKISKGDVVIVKQIKQGSINYEDIKVGDILAYKHNNIIVVHRIINIVNDNNKYYFYTKGDANDFEDNFKIEEDNLIGIVKFKINKIGYPTVWLSELS